MVVVGCVVQALGCKHKQAKTSVVIIDTAVSTALPWMTARPLALVLTGSLLRAAAGSPVNGEASSPPPAINDNRPPGDSLDTILFQLRQVTRERDELRKRLALASPGTTFDDCR